MSRLRWSTLGFGLAALGLLPGCGGGGGGGGYSGGGGGTPPPATPATINVGGTSSDPYGGGTDVLMFNPAALTVSAGTTVTWVFQADGHAVASGTGCSPDNLFNSGIRAKGATFQQTFNQKGTFPFYCTTHCGQAMKGTITVQ